MSLLDPSEETTRVGTALLLRAITRPDLGTPIPGYAVRMMTAQRVGAFPPMRLYYSYDDATLFLLWIEVYDDLT